MNSLIGIYNSDGDRLSEDSLSLFGLKLHIPSPSYGLITESIDGRGGAIILDKTLEPRQLIARFFTKSRSYEDSLRLRDELYSILSSGEEIYVSEARFPGKRWKVQTQGWTPDRINSRMLQFEIPLLAPRGLSESVNVATRTYTDNSFRFCNEGNVPIDMRTQDETEVTFIGVSEKLTITNLSTEEIWQYDGTTTSSDIITLKGVRSLKNGDSIFGQTNRRLISFDPGWNDLKVEGAVGPFQLIIQSRYYFL